MDLLKKTSIYFLILIIPGINFSCNRFLIKTATREQNTIIFPAPPDSARIQYLTKFSKSTDITGEQSSFSKFIVGEEVSRVISKPYGIIIHKGKIYICDTGSKSIEIIDLDKRTFEYFTPQGQGLLKLPINCFIDDRDYLYVADVGRKQVVIYDDKQNYITAIGEKENYKPTDVFVYDNNIYIVNIKSDKINVYSATSYELLYSIPQSETGTEGQIYSPSNIYISNDIVYVSDFGDFKVKSYDLQGNYISSVGSYGRNLGQFVRPKGVAVDKDENLFVVDAGFENIQIFDRNHNLLMFFGGPYTGPGYMYLPAKLYIDYENLKYFKKYADPAFDLKYIILVSNQYGPDKVSIYGAVSPKKK